MIETRERAAAMALTLAAATYDTPNAQQIFVAQFADGKDWLFDEVLHYRLTAAATYEHYRANYPNQSVLEGLGAWSETGAPFQLAMTVYAAVVPILSGLIIVPLEEPPEARAPAPGRGFDSINADESNRGSIYEREDWTKPQAVAPAAAEPAAPDGADAQAGEVPAAAGEAGEVVAEADQQPAVTYDAAGEGGDVVDDDDEDTEGAEGGEVEGDGGDPPVTDEKPKRRRSK